jgi:RHS repeat-associated protein
VLATSDGVLDLYGLARIGEVRSGEWAYPLGDALGSVRQWVDGDEYVSYAVGYTPFGMVLWQEGSAGSAWGYTGEWWDDSAGLLYLRARWYGPEMGRFASLDTIALDYSNPQTINRYAYALGNPINFADPTGHCVSDCECFVEEVRWFIALARSHTLLGTPLNDNWVVHMLGGYYAGFRVT